MTNPPDVPTAYSPMSASSYDQIRFTTAAGRQIHDMEAMIVREHVSRLPAEACVLEVGCGTGRLMMEYRQLSLHLTGCDATESMLAEFRKKLGDLDRSITLDQAEAAVLPYPDSAFDFVPMRSDC